MTTVAPSTGALLIHWSLEPSVLLGTAALTGAYFYAVGPLRRKHNLGPPPTRTQINIFIASVVLLLIALVSPLDYIGDEYLFSAHMVQHLILATVWPPLVLLAMPCWIAEAMFRRPGAAVLRFFTYPAAALIFFNLDIYLWHAPALYNLTLQNEYVHIAEHLSFMLFGLFTWWPVLSPIPSERLSAPLQTLYLFANAMFMMVLGIVFTFIPTVLYAPYAHAPRLWGISAITDQQIGGLIMWYPGNLPYATWLVIAFYRWFDAGGPEAQRIPQQSPTIGPPAG
jgi:putative membrane protein